MTTTKRKTVDEISELSDVMDRVLKGVINNGYKKSKLDEPVIEVKKPEPESKIVNATTRPGRPSVKLPQSIHAGRFGIPLTQVKPFYTLQDLLQIIDERESILYEGYTELKKDLENMRSMKSWCGDGYTGYIS
jgi:hypothetical protein